MNREEWLAKRDNGGSIQKLLRERGTLVHTSVHFVRNPLSIQAELKGKPFDGPEFVQFGKSKSLDVGSNILKRRYRRAHVKMRVAAREAR